MSYILRPNCLSGCYTKEVEGKFPKIKTIFKAQDLGGWDEIQKKFFDEGAIFDKIRAKKF